MLDRNIHKTILLQILKDIYTDASLGPNLGFKGGTAANLFHNLGRFSVDLDFDLLNGDKKTIVFEKLEKMLPEYGAIKEKYNKKHTLLFVISYNEKSPNIKVEVNLRIFGSRYELKNYLGISMLIMTKEDMFAHKLVAALERKRTANRDVYDIWHFLKNHWPINKEIVEKRTGMSFQSYMKTCIEFIDSLSDRNILSGMGELLEVKQKSWVKMHLRKDTVFLLKVRLEQDK
jgi:predicted nucleotidyltransferase component of viral defense system